MRTLLALVLALALLVAPVFAEPVGAAIAAESTLPQYQVSPASTTVYAGLIKEINLTVQKLTDWWAGVVGNIVGGTAVLGTGTNVFFDWTLTNPTVNVVVFASDQDINWDTVNQGVTTAYIQGIISGWTPSADESFENTYLAETAAGDECNFAEAALGLPELNANYVDLPKGSSTWRVCAYTAQDTAATPNNELVFVAEVNADQTWAGGTYDFAALLPATTTGTVYYVYTS